MSQKKCNYLGLLIKFKIETSFKINSENVIILVLMVNRLQSHKSRHILAV